MTEPDIQRTGRRQLARLWQCDTDPVGAWRPEELAAMFKHLLASPLVAVLDRLDRPLPEYVQQGEAASGGKIETFGDLFRTPQPPLEVLHLVKRYGKHAGNDGALPVDLAAVLYAAAIAAGLVRWGRRISSADDRGLQSRFEWAASRTWIDPDTQGLLEAAIAQLPTSASEPLRGTRIAGVLALLKSGSLNGLSR